MVTTEADTCRRFAMQSRSKWLLAAGFCGLVLLDLVRGAGVKEERWLFLSGTATPDTDQHYPSILYTNDGTNKLRVVKQIVSSEDGTHSIHSYSNIAFVLYPHSPSTTITIVHTEKLALADEVVFNPDGKVVVDSKVALSEPDQHRLDELVFLLAGPEDRSGILTSISASASAREERIRRNQWNEYSFLRFDGTPGGPIQQPDLVGSSDGSAVGIRVFDNQARVATLPRDVAQAVQGRIPVYLAANERYMIFMLQHRVADLRYGALAKRLQEKIYVRDQNTGLWATSSVDGTCSRTRIFGNWLATIVQFWDPNHKQNPGTEHERSTRTDILPNVRGLYAMSAGRNCFIPGDLALLNLKTQLRIAVHTGEEDSEILGVEDDIVLYRVNDIIYQAKIVGDQLKDSTLVVKDDDVPEIHWAFWSK
ncbi:MAG: hypothetical protein WA789_04860 [Candidatus Acidiferrum sp.]